MRSEGQSTRADEAASASCAAVPTPSSTVLPRRYFQTGGFGQGDNFLRAIDAAASYR